MNQAALNGFSFRHAYAKWTFHLTLNQHAFSPISFRLIIAGTIHEFGHTTQFSCGSTVSLSFDLDAVSGATRVLERFNQLAPIVLNDDSARLLSGALRAWFVQLMDQRR